MILKRSWQVHPRSSTLASKVPLLSPRRTLSSPAASSFSIRSLASCPRNCAKASQSSSPPSAVMTQRATILSPSHPSRSGRKFPRSLAHKSLRATRATRKRQSKKFGPISTSTLSYFSIARVRRRLCSCT